MEEGGNPPPPKCYNDCWRIDERCSTTLTCYNINFYSQYILYIYIYISVYSASFFDSILFFFCTNIYIYIYIYKEQSSESEISPIKPKYNQDPSLDSLGLP